MKKIIAFAGVFALAACGGDAEEPTETETEVVEVEDTATAPGTYTSTTEEGAELAVALNADGSYTVSEAGEQVDAGSWEDTDEGTCLMAEGAEPTCFDIAPGAGSGMYDITGEDGVVMSYSFES